MDFTIIESPFRPTAMETISETPEQIRSRLGVLEQRDTKTGPGIIPATFRPCPERCWNASKLSSNCGGGQLHRLAWNVTAMTGFAVDLDHAPQTEIDALLNRLARENTLAFYWQTYSHVPDAPRYRILIPFDTPLPIHEPRNWSHNIWVRLTRHFGLEETSDRQTRDPARLYYLPAAPFGETREVGAISGNLFAVRSVIRFGMSPTTTLQIRPLPRKEIDPTRAIDIEKIRAKVNKFSPHARNMLAGKPLTPPSSTPNRTHSHYEAWLSALGCLSHALEGWEHRETVLEAIARESWSKEEAEEPNPGTSWEVLVRMFEGSCDTVADHRARLLAISRAKAEASVAALRALMGNRGARCP